MRPSCLSDPEVASTEAQGRRHRQRMDLMLEQTGGRAAAAVYLPCGGDNQLSSSLSSKSVCLSLPK